MLSFQTDQQHHRIQLKKTSGPVYHPKVVLNMAGNSEQTALMYNCTFVDTCDVDAQHLKLVDSQQTCAVLLNDDQVEGTTKVLQTDFELADTCHWNPLTLEVSQVNVSWLKLLNYFSGTRSVEDVINMVETANLESTPSHMAFL